MEIAMIIEKSEQLIIAKNIKTSVLLWELLNREEVSAITITVKNNNKMLYKNNNNLWNIKDIKNA